MGQLFSKQQPENLRTIAQQRQQRNVPAPPSTTKEYSRGDSLAPSEGQDKFDPLGKFLLLVWGRIEDLYRAKGS
jgi:hypothetical protein